MPLVSGRGAWTATKAGGRYRHAMVAAFTFGRRRSNTAFLVSRLASPRRLRLAVVRLRDFWAQLDVTHGMSYVLMTIMTCRR
jgi:hypothetical protein